MKYARCGKQVEKFVCASGIFLFRLLIITKRHVNLPPARFHVKIKTNRHVEKKRGWRQ